LVRAYVAKPGNEACGLLHVVLDDGNIGRNHIEYAHDEALRQGDTDALFIAYCLLDMTMTQRRKVSHNVYLL
jgi:hypothetical protein